MLKEFVILVKSVKNRQNCVAGLELENIGDDVLLTNEWIRPVSRQGDNGAVRDSEIAYADDRQPRFLDVIQIEVEGPEGKPNQPENWVIADKQWIKLGRLPKTAISAALATHPDDLWLGTNRKTDRIRVEDYHLFDYQSSIHLIQPERLQVQIYTERVHYQRFPKQRRRAIFSYNGVEYNLPITDRDMDRKYFHDFPGLGDGKHTIELEGQNHLLAISLSPEYRDNYYKIVGNIIEI